VADAQKTIDLVFNGVDKTGAAVQSVIGNTEKFAGSVQSATQPIADFTFAALKFEAAVLAAGTAVVGFGIKAADTFDTAFAEITTLFDAPTEDIAAFREELFQFATTESSFSLDQVTSSIYAAISAGTDYADSIDTVRNAEQLAIAGRADLQESLVVLVSSLNAYGASSQEAGQYADFLFQTVRDGQTTLPELASNLSKVTQTAAGAQVPFEEVLSAIAALTAAGAPTAQAVTSINAAINAIINPSTGAAQAAKALGIEFSASRLASAGLATVLGDVQRATGGNVEKIGELFENTRALSGVITLTGTGAEKFTSTLNNMANSSGAVSIAFQKMSGDLGLAAQRIFNSFQGVLINLGEPFLDEVGSIADGIASIFNAIADNFDEGQLAGLTSFLEQGFASFAETLQQVAANLPAALQQADLSGFQNGLTALGEALSSIFGDIDLTTVEGLARALTLAGNGFQALQEFTAGVIDSLGPIFEQVTGIANGLLDLNPEVFRAAGEFAGFATQANLAAGAITQLLPSINALIGLIAANQGVSLVSSLGKAAVALSGSGGLLGLLGSAGLVGAAGAAGAAVGTMANNLTEAATGTSISTWLGDLVDKFFAGEDSAYAIADSLNEVKDVSYETGGALKDLNVNAAKTGGSMEDLAGAAENSEQRVYNFSTGLFEVVDATNSASQGLIDGTAALLPYTGALENAGEAWGTLEAETRSSAGTLSFVKNEFSDAAKKVNELDEAAKALSLDEKLALIESQSQVTVAQIEADTARIVSAFESVNVGIESTGDLLADLYGIFADPDISLREQFRIEREIERERELREKEFALQEKLTNATIREIEARAKALENGDALITINGDGLQPHLEAFMYAVLEEVQVRSNNEGLALLLGT